MDRRPVVDGYDEEEPVAWIDMRWDEGVDEDDEPFELPGWVIFLAQADGQTGDPIATIYRPEEDRELAMQVAQLIAARHGGVPVKVR
jgi:hypothetical protein